MIKRHLYSNVYCSVIHNSQDIETSKESPNGTMDTEKCKLFAQCKERLRSCHLEGHEMNLEER